MAAAMQIQLEEQEAETIRQLANELHWTPDRTVEEAMSNGLHMLRRYAALVKRSETADIAKGIEILKRVGLRNPPDPGDEMPDDLKDLLDQPSR